MKTRTLNTFRQIVYAKSGIALSDKKEALVCARVGKRVRALGLGSYEQYLDVLQNDESGAEMVELLDAVCTNVTSFFRDAEQFDFLVTQMRSWIAAGQTRFRFWSAASSTGEEPYSLAIALLEAAEGRALDMRILATDLSTTALEQCRAGVYEERKIQTVPPPLLSRYFSVERFDGVRHYRVKPELTRMVVIRRMNLSQPPFPMRGPLDAILCRNVMIYFDNPVRQRLLADIHRLLKDGGYLFVGHAESLTGIVSPMKYVRPAIYTRS
ncbi:MAG: methyltransferase domain-containing protein [Coriobacteriia bacterium]|nr:methyltransferase domain-containing protein [Coriobacteriia bacterium]MBN2840488.1 methyltransferase domain-containing protein [Coriobacteriia bacterium]